MIGQHKFTSWHVFFRNDLFMQAYIHNAFPCFGNCSVFKDVSGHKVEKVIVFLYFEKELTGYKVYLFYWLDFSFRIDEIKFIMRTRR